MIRSVGELGRGSRGMGVLGGEARRGGRREEYVGKDAKMK